MDERGGEALAFGKGVSLLRKLSSQITTICQKVWKVGRELMWEEGREREEREKRAKWEAVAAAARQARVVANSRRVEAQIRGGKDLCKRKRLLDARNGAKSLARQLYR